MRKTDQITRFVRHLFYCPLFVRRYFSQAALERVTSEIAASECTHTGEIRFVVEAALHPLDVLAGKTPRQRAIELFARLGIWDTEENNGVLIYLLLADRDVEIIADRGIDRKVGGQAWERICRQMEDEFRASRFEAGVLTGIAQMGSALELHFPSSTPNHNELPDRPLVL